MRKKILFNDDWLFHKGDIKNPTSTVKGLMYIGAKTERYHIGPACKDYFAEPDSYREDIEHKAERWDRVTLPHDYIIEGVPDVRYNNALGFFKYENAWYRKNFYIDKEDFGKRITLLFEGIATHSVIYLNGAILKRNFSGYNSFEVDLTDMIKYGEKNVLAVYVNTEEHEGWWYSGGGIYRNVFLNITDPVAVDLWGIYAKPIYKGDKNWDVETTVTVRNDTDKTVDVKAVLSVIDKNGNTVQTLDTCGAVLNKDVCDFKVNFNIDNPYLWSPDTPDRYTMRAEIFVGDKNTDIYEVKFGFRTVKIDPDKGLFINDKHYKIKGVCGHADCGLLGKAVPDNVHRYKVKLIKEMGANGYRTSHYMQSEALMEELDKNGFIVMDETRWFESTDDGKAQLTALMKRDRNRPSVVFWSVGNEEPHHTTEEGRRIAKTLMALAHKLDDSRFIMSAVVHSPDVATVYDELEVIGINYNWNKYEYVHKKYPNKGIFSSECCATSTTRGWYFEPDTTRGYLPAYDRDSSEDWKGREFTWKYLGTNDWLLGGYQWIAFEHRGEAIWPRVCSQSGAIDLFMQKKDAFYQNKSHWDEKPMVHLLPHWNFNGFEGEPIRVVAYTNQSRVELFLNGQSLGVKDVEKFGHAEWSVPYQKGEILAKAYGTGGEIVATDKKVTSGEPYKLMLTLDNPDVSANGQDVAFVSCYVVDKDGNEVPTAEPFVHFIAEGAGKVWSTGSDISEHASIYSPDRKMRAGRIGVAVKLGKKEGDLKVIATADGLLPAILKAQIK